MWGTQEPGPCGWGGVFPTEGTACVDGLEEARAWDEERLGFGEVKRDLVAEPQ